MPGNGVSKQDTANTREEVENEQVAQPDANTREEVENEQVAQPDAKTREEVKKEKTAKPETKETGKKRVRVRLIPIWMRIVLIFLLLVLSLTIGTIVGYSVIGTGDPMDALKSSTWTHIVELINKEK